MMITTAPSSAMANASTNASAGASAGTSSSKNAAAPAQAADTSPASSSTSAPAASAGAGAGAAAAGGAQPFARWLGQQAGSPATVDAAALQDVTPAGADDAPATGDAPGAQAATQDDAGATPAAPAQDGALLSAMAPPMMPLSPLQAAQALQAMLPAQGGAGKTDDVHGEAATPAAGALPAIGRGDAGAAHTARTAIDPSAAAQDATLALASNTARGAAAIAIVPSAQQQSGADAVAHAAAAATAAANTQDDGAGHGAASSAPAGTTPTVNAAALAAAPAPSAPAADTVKLAGPPTAWRQSLQEALGDRLNVQVTKNVEQAVIRLEPPQLGRIDIAIRHSAGTLEVNISASNGDVLRQLQNVSDNLRSDLSQRQFTEVAVNVTPAPRNGGAAPFGDPQQQGRGRQPGRDQDQDPGRALAEADTSGAAFTLDRRA